MASAESRVQIRLWRFQGERYGLRPTVVEITKEDRVVDIKFQGQTYHRSANPGKFMRVERSAIGRMS